MRVIETVRVITNCRTCPFHLIQKDMDGEVHFCTYFQPMERISLTINPLNDYGCPMPYARGRHYPTLPFVGHIIDHSLGHAGQRAGEYGGVLLYATVLPMPGGLTIIPLIGRQPQTPYVVRNQDITVIYSPPCQDDQEWRVMMGQAVNG